MFPVRASGCNSTPPSPHWAPVHAQDSPRLAARASRQAVPTGIQRFPTLASVATVMALTLLSSCSHLETMSDCRKLAAVVNPRLDEIEAAHAKGDADSNNWLTIHKGYQILEKDLKKLRSEDKKLEKFRAELVNLTRRSALLSSSVENALRRDYGKTLHSSKSQLKLIAAEQKRLSQRIERHCKP